MIRPPMESLKRRPFETFALLLLIALAFVLPGTAAILGLMTEETTTQWLSRYEPHVYLSPEASPDQITALKTELAGWPGVASATVRTPKEAVKTLETRLGKETVQHLGLGPAMMPTSIVLKPNVPVVDHIALIAKASGLDVRETIAAVDVPSAEASKLLQTTKTFVSAALVMIALLYVLALVLLCTCLKRMVRDEQEELALLERFGASSFALLRASWVRGGTMGLAAGILATAALLSVQFSGQVVGQSLTHSTWGVSWSWAIVFAPLVLGPLQGMMAGHLVVLGIKHTKTQAYRKTKPLLRFGPAIA